MNKMNKVILYNLDTSTKVELPYADGGIRAGFPSPSQDYLEEALNLNEEHIHNPAATFIGRVVGDSMIDANVHEGDLLVIDRSRDAVDGSMIVGYLDGEFCVKLLDLSQRQEGIIWLVPANDRYPRIKITEDQDFRIWGVVSYVIHKT